MKQHVPNRKRHVLKPATVRQLCHEESPIGGGDEPVRAIGWTDLRGRWTRVEVDYPNGWKLSLSFDKAGAIQGIRARAKFMPIVKAAEAV